MHEPTYHFCTIQLGYSTANQPQQQKLLASKAPY